MRLNGAQDLTVIGNRDFGFPTGLSDGSVFHVSVAKVPGYRRCDVNGGDGKVNGQAITSVQVDCSPTDLAVANSTVRSSVLSEDGQTLFIGGEFTEVGQRIGSLARLDATSGAAAGPFPQVVGSVEAIAADGRGGWFVGGTISQVEGQARTGVVHLLANGSLDTAFSAPADGPVTHLLQQGGRLYVGGGFTQIGGVARTRLAALDPASGQTLAGWRSDANAYVNAMASDGQALFVGGSFSVVGGQARNRLAALDLQTGQALAWNAGLAGAYVAAVSVAAGQLFIAGDFSTVGGQPRRHIAALSTSTAQALAWNPGCSQAVSRMLASSTTVYVVTPYTTRCGGAGGGVVALDRSSGTPRSFSGAVNGQLYSMALDGSLLYLAGRFSEAGGAVRSDLAALDADTGLATAWTPRIGGAKWKIAASGGRVVLGGDGLLGNVRARNGLAAISLLNGAVTAWNPNPGGPDDIPYWGMEIPALLRVGNTLYVGGNFVAMGGQPRAGLAAVNATTGAVLAFNPAAGPSFVLALSVSGNRLFVGGYPDLWTGPALVALDTTSGAALWDGGITGAVRTLRSAYGKLWVGGDFSTATDQARLGAAAYALDTLALDVWNPQVDRSGSGVGQVMVLVPTADRVYLGGRFDTVGGTTRANLAAVDAASGALLAWSPGVSGSGQEVSALRLSGSLLYLGGSFTRAGGATRVHLAAVDTTAGLATAWAPRPNNRVRTLQVLGEGVIAGGHFSAIDGRPARALMAIPR